MTVQSKASSLIFAHLVNRGMDRAFRVAEVLEAAHPGLDVQVSLSDEVAIQTEDPQELPRVLFVLSGPEDQEGVHVPLDMTEGGMSGFLERKIPDVMRGNPPAGWEPSPGLRAPNGDC